MKKFGKRKSEEDLFSDPLAGVDAVTPDTGEPGRISGRRTSRRSARKRNKAGRIIRADDVEHLLENNEDIDPDAIISMYRPQRRARRFGAALLRLDKLYLTLMGLLLIVASLFILSFMQEKMGNFTINLNRLELYRKGIAISADSVFTEPTARLTASAVQDATNISIGDLPGNLDYVDGDHNGENYMAYTYYVRNAGKEDVGYVATVTLESYAKGAENAVRVAVWHNGEKTVYAEPSATGEPEEGCVNFLSHDLVCEYREEEFLVGNVDKYTVVIWMEGDDPECVDAIIGGSVEFAMDIHATTEDDTTLLYKFVQDIVDALTGDKPIFAAGTEAPDYYKPEDITWENRRNQ